ncbi:MAG: BamA/TamA family outer membrane protein, partial [Casimicrobiaceae bacterium]
GSDFRGDSFFNLAASYRRTWINSLGAEWRTDAQVGRTTRLETEFYQPLRSDGAFFIAPHAGVERRSADLFADSQQIARYNIRTTEAALDVGAVLGTFGEARLGVLTGTVDSTLDIGPPALAPEGKATRGAATAQIVIDRLDSANFPRAGYAGSAHIYASRQALGASDAYTKWDADFLSAYAVGRHTISVAGRAGGPLGSGPLPRYDLFQWGGFLQQSGYPMGALVGQQLVFGRIVYTYKLAQQRLLEGVYAGVSLEAGRMDEPLVPQSPTGLLKSTSAFLGLDTPLGPLYIGYGWAADGNRSAYLYLGRP